MATAAAMLGAISEATVVPARADETDPRPPAPPAADLELQASNRAKLADFRQHRARVSSNARTAEYSSFASSAASSVRLSVAVEAATFATALPFSVSVAIGAGGEARSTEVAPPSKKPQFMRVVVMAVNGGLSALEGKDLVVSVKAVMLKTTAGALVAPPPDLTSVSAAAAEMVPVAEATVDMAASLPFLRAGERPPPHKVKLTKKGKLVGKLTLSLMLIGGPPAVVHEDTPQYGLLPTAVPKEEEPKAEGDDAAGAAAESEARTMGATAPK